VVVTLLIFRLAGALKREFPDVRALRGCARALHILIGVQLLLGAAAWWSLGYAATFPQPVLITVFLTVAHVVTGALVLASTLVTTLICHRLLRPAADSALESAEPVAIGTEQTA
jgi:hypothetical protein